MSDASRGHDTGDRQMSHMGELVPTGEMYGTTVPSPTLPRHASPLPAPDNF